MKQKENYAGGGNFASNLQPGN